MAETNSRYYFVDMRSAVGPLRIVASDLALVEITWNRDENPRTCFPGAEPDNGHVLLMDARRQLEEYFAGHLSSFDLPVDLAGTTFQKKVWETIMEIPYRKTISYGELAKRLGDIKTARAVGGALNKNPIPIVVPCHRVIGSTGELVGFGGGLKNKSLLLELEMAVRQLDLWN